MRALLIASLSLSCLACTSTSMPPPEFSPLGAPGMVAAGAPGDPAAMVPAGSQNPPYPYQAYQPVSIADWPVGRPLMQGFIGWTAFDEVSVEGSGGVEIDGDQGDLDEFPLFGGGGQLKLLGEGVDVGVEGLVSIGGRANADAFVVGGGGAIVAVDVDMLVIELYGGPFLSFFLGEKLRLYGAAGPLLQWIDYDQEGNSFDDDGSGFGAGFYARTGLEFLLPSRILVGFGARWSDTSVDLDGNFGDIDVQGLEYFVSFSRL